MGGTGWWPAHRSQFGPPSDRDNLQGRQEEICCCQRLNSSKRKLEYISRDDHFKGRNPSELIRFAINLAAYKSEIYSKKKLGSFIHA
jgi:hypothetical protein